MIIDITIHCAVNGLVGALIGATTNELAVIWIFRKVIPKRKTELAAAIKRVVAEELVEPEAIARKLRSERVRGVVEKNLSSLLERELTRELPSPNELFAKHRSALETYESRLIDVVEKQIVNHLSGDDFPLETLKEFVKKEIETLLAKHPLDASTGLDRFVDSIPERTVAFLRTGEFRQRAVTVATDLLFPLTRSSKTLEDTLPPSLTKELKRSLESKLPRIGDKVADFLEREDVQNKLAESIERELADRIDEKLPSFVRKPLAFVDDVLKKKYSRGSLSLIGLDDEIKQFCSRIPDRVRDEMSDEANESELKGTLNELADDVMKTPLSDLLHFATRETFQSTLDKLFNDIMDETVRHRLGVQMETIVRSTLDADLKSHLQTLLPDLNADALADLVVAKVAAALKTEETRRWLRGELTDMARALREKPIGRLGRHLNKDARRTLSRLAADAFIEAVSARVGDFADEADLWEIIEDKIKDLDARSIERLARRVANSELKLVVLMGGVIGFVIGVAQGFL